MTTLRFTVPGPPVGKQRPRVGKGGNVYTPAETRSYEAKVQAYAVAAVSGLALRGIRWPTTDRKARYAGTILVVTAEDRGDGDNFEKAIYDALQGVVYANDKQVREGHWRVEVDAANPRVEVTIERRTT